MANRGSNEEEEEEVEGEEGLIVIGVCEQTTRCTRCMTWMMR